MKFNVNKLIASVFLFTMAFVAVTSCNKDVEDPAPIVTPAQTGRTLLDSINGDPNLNILEAAIARASTNTSFGNTLTAILNDRTANFTVFAPTDAAFATIGITTPAALAAFRPGQLDTILRNHIVGGRITSDTIARRSPNLQLPTQLVLQAPSASLPPGLRMPIFPSRNVNTFFVNNIPMSQTDISLANGVINRIGSVLLPPQQFLWDRINTDPNLTYLKAAVARADSGVAATSTLTAALQNPAANLTVFAPTDSAFQAILTAQITQTLVGLGVPPATALAQATALASTPAVFTNPLLSSVLTPTNVRGLVAYHLLGNRRFTVNFPTTATPIPTVAHGSVPTLPLITIQATFGTNNLPATASVKGGLNATASNITISPTPAPAGTSDQNYVNGVLHIIDQLLRPQ